MSQPTPVDKCVSRITKQVHPEDLGKPTSELESILYREIEQLIEDLKN